MPVTVVGGRPTAFNTAVTCQRVDGLPPAGCGAVLRIDAPAGVNVFVVRDGVTTDGAALPANFATVPGGMVDRFVIASDPILIAGSGVGVCTINVEPGGPIA